MLWFGADKNPKVQITIQILSKLCRPLASVRLSCISHRNKQHFENVQYSALLLPSLLFPVSSGNIAGCSFSEYFTYIVLLVQGPEENGLILMACSAAQKSEE